MEHSIPGRVLSPSMVNKGTMGAAYENAIEIWKKANYFLQEFQPSIIEGDFAQKELKGFNLFREITGNI